MTTAAYGQPGPPDTAAPADGPEGGRARRPGTGSGGPLCALPRTSRARRPRIQAATAADGEALLAGKLAADRVPPPAGGSGPGPRRPGDAASQRLSHRGDHHGGQVPRAGTGAGRQAAATRTGSGKGVPLIASLLPVIPGRHVLARPACQPGQPHLAARPASSRGPPAPGKDPPSLMPHAPRNRCPDLPHDRQVPQGRTEPPASLT